jgi:hypothetical protein
MSENTKHTHTDPHTPCRLIIYRNVHDGGSSYSLETTVQVHDKISTAVTAGYAEIDRRSHFHVVQPAGAPLKFYWIGRPSDTRRDIADKFDELYGGGGLPPVQVPGGITLGATCHEPECDGELFNPNTLDGGLYLHDFTLCTEFLRCRECGIKYKIDLEIRATKGG